MDNREAFEAAHKFLYPFGSIRQLDKDDDEYRYSRTRKLHRLWQAATAQSQAELQRVKDGVLMLKMEANSYAKIVETEQEIACQMQKEFYAAQAELAKAQARIVELEALVPRWIPYSKYCAEHHKWQRIDDKYDFTFVLPWSPDSRPSIPQPPKGEL